jgi:hypothetical protein
VINPAGQKRSKILHRLLYREHKLKAIARKLLPHRTRTAALRWLSERNVSPQMNPPLSEELRQLLIPKFNPDIDRLGELIGRDLDHWKA